MSLVSGMRHFDAEYDPSWDILSPLGCVDNLSRCIVISTWNLDSFDDTCYQCSERVLHQFFQHRGRLPCLSTDARLFFSFDSVIFNNRRKDVVLREHRPTSALRGTSDLFGSSGCR